MIDTLVILNSLSTALLPVSKAILEQFGVKPDSKMIASMEFQSDDKLVNFIVNDYFEYVSLGRRAGARKVPIEYLLMFIKQNNISPKGKQTLNQLAFAIQTSIYKNGIQGKNYLDTFINAVADYSTDRFADDYTLQVADEITLNLTQN
jgi:hypothetical protein